MTTLLLLAALAVAGAGVGISRRWRVFGQAVMVAGGLGLMGVVVLEVRQNVLPQRPDARKRCAMAVSYGLANCLLGDMSGQSGKVVLLFPPRSVMDAETEKNYEDGFLLSLRHGRANLKLKAARLEGAKGDLAAFKRTLEQDREAMAVVSFAGAPEGLDTLFSAGQTEGPSFYVFDADGTTRWLGALKAGRIKAVVVPRPGTDVRDAEGMGRMPEKILDRFFLLATPENAEEIAAGLKTESKVQR
jgi:hypothetical protein